MVKIIACLTMLVDHVGYVFFPEERLFRMIGRLSMPLFAYMIARGYQVTGERGTRRRYVLGLAVLAVVSQIPRELMLRSGQIQLNCVFSWLIGIGVLKILEDRSISAVLLTAIIILTSSIGILEYDFLAISLAVLFYFTKTNHERPAARYAGNLALIVAYELGGGWSLSAYSLYALPVIDMVECIERKHPVRRRIPKITWYIFYPVHMCLLALARILVDR